MNSTTHWTPVTGLLQWEATQPDAIYMTQPVNGEVIEYSWAQTADQVRRMAGYLQSLDLPAGSRIALLSRNCAHYIMADLAIWMAGHVSVPVYPSLNSETLSFILEHSETRLLFLGPLDDWSSMQPGVPSGMSAVLLPGAPSQGLPDFSQEWDSVIASAEPMAEPVQRHPEEVARLVYTSGSTGVPKGVMVPFRAIAAGATLLGNAKDMTTVDRMISYLPLAHVFEAAVVEASSLRYGFQVFFSEGLASFADDLRRARPTVFHSVPRLWVKFQQAVQAKLPQEKLDALLADEATAGPTRQQVLTQLGLQDTQVAVTGSAPLAPSVQQWYRDLGLELLEGYAMSEDFAYSHLSLPGRSKVGYVGHAAPGVERRIAENGEVQIKSPGGMLGYYKSPDKTEEAYTGDGWFRTGDLGEVDEDGRLRITGRLKELFKTAKGKYVAPVPIECKLGHPQVEVVCVSGANHTQPYVLMMPSPAAADALSSEEGRAALAAAIESQLESVNATLDPHEHLAFAVMVRDAWTIENGMLTPTMKIKRNVIEDRYAANVDDWYAAGQRVIWE